MLYDNQANLATWLIAGAATFGVVARPWNVPEAVWALAGALGLVIAGLLSWSDALTGVANGLDVYLFLTGMMLLAELARREGIFDALASMAVRHARGSGTRLFTLVYGIGVLVTVFMSNDATAVVLTPAVYAAAKKAGVKPLPYLLACAFIANAASFVLPISNPANLVIFGDHLPPLVSWVERFALPSLASIVLTYVALRWMNRQALSLPVKAEVEPAELSTTGQMTAWGIVVMILTLLVASALAMPLGMPTFAAASLVTMAVLCKKRASPLPMLKSLSWSVLLLVAGLFVLVEGVARSGLIQALSEALRSAAVASPMSTAWGASAVVALACNLVNNLPAGLMAGAAVAGAGVTTHVQSAIAIGIDLGPNLSVTGSLATILWLIAIRREGENVSAWQFLRVGMVAMPLALIGALAALSMQAQLTP